MNKSLFQSLTPKLISVVWQKHEPVFIAIQLFVPQMGRKVDLLDLPKFKFKTPALKF